MLSASAKAGVGAAGLALVGCGDDEGDDDEAVAATPDAQADAQADAAVPDEDDADGDADAEVEAGPAPGEPRVCGKITVHGPEPSGFDQYLNPGGGNTAVIAYGYPMLTQIQSGPGRSPLLFEPEPSLADTIEQPDNTTHVFTLKPNAVWEDVEPTNGRAITAEDVVETYTGEPYKTQHNNRAILLPHMASVEAVDAATVRFDLNKPVAPFLLYTGHQSGPRIMPPEARIDEATRNRMVSGGPYKMATYDVGSKVTFVRNENYFEGDQPAAFLMYYGSAVVDTVATRSIR